MRFTLPVRMVAVATAALLAVAACSSTGPATEARTGIILGRSMDVTTLDISRSLCDTCQIYNSAVYETLIHASPDDGSLEPLLASSWKANTDNTEFTFTLRDDAVFSDGSPVEAKDVAWSWERLQNLGGSPSYFMSGVKSVEAPDAHTVVVTTSAPNSAFFNIVTASYMGVINSDVASENGATADKDAAKTDQAEQWFMANSAGSGQYQLGSYAEGSQLVLKANPNYWGTKPNFTDVTFKQVADSSAQLQQLQQGDIDVAMQLSFDALDQIKSDANITSSVVPSYNFVYVGLAPGAPGGAALKNVKVREAFRKAIDYDAVIDATVAGQGEKQSTAIPNGFEGTDGLTLPEYDPDGAKALLAEAGYADGLKLEATYPNFTIYGVNFTTMFQSIQQSLKASGIELTLHPLEYTAWATLMGGDGAAVTSVYFAPDHPDTIQYVQYFGMIEGSSWLARSGTGVSAEETSLAAKALTQTGDARTATYNALGKAMYDDQIILPIVNPKYLLASSADVTGNNYDITRNLDLSRLSFKS
ncbi:ABC transporter substrate-binding protein [Actinoplanes sp. NPDC051851]|uniref:ABC transporter substrate-binding protein n=1 Tax=Actinoplanes sp. NPDC051851 TaxID=3154753 RepID=UPI00341DDC51